MKALKLTTIVLASTIIAACSSAPKEIEKQPVKKEYISVQLKSYTIDLSKRATQKIPDCEPFDHEEQGMDYKSICESKLQSILSKEIDKKDPKEILEKMSKYGYTKQVHEEAQLVENGDRLDGMYEFKIKNSLKKPKLIADEEHEDINKSDLTYAPIVILKSNKILVNYIYYYNGTITDKTENNSFDSLGNKLLDEKDTALLYVSNVENDKYLITTISAEKIDN